MIVKTHGAAELRVRLDAAAQPAEAGGRKARPYDTMGNGTAIVNAPLKNGLLTLR